MLNTYQARAHCNQARPRITNTIASAVIACALISCMAVLHPSLAHAQKAPASTTINLGVGQQKTLNHSNPISRAAVGDPEIVAITALGRSTLLITPKKPGSTTVSIWDAKSDTTEARQYLVVVSQNLDVSRAAVKAIDPQAQVEGAGPSLKLSGEMRSLDTHALSREVLKQSLPESKNGSFVDGSTNKFDMQVQIDIRILEVSRNKLKEAGFNYLRTNGGRYAGIYGPGSFGGFELKDGFTTLLTNGGGAPFTDAFNIFSFKLGGGAYGIFSALESNGFAYALAEPSLTALNGQTATFLAGGELPIPLSGGNGSVSVEFKEFGIRVSLTPTILDEDRIILKVAPEVSEIDNALTIDVGNFVVPGLRVRRTETTVALANGESFVISGLMNRSVSSNIDKFPGLGDIPIIGAFFKSTRFQRDDQELLMIATAHIVRPFAKNAPLPALPAEGARRYDPSFWQMLLIENGKSVDPLTGFTN